MSTTSTTSLPHLATSLSYYQLVLQHQMHALANPWDLLTYM